MPASGAPHVVTTEDFAEEDLKALDWTHLSPECLGGAQTDNPDRFPVCPLPYIALKPPVIAPPSGPVGLPSRTAWAPWLSYGGSRGAILDPAPTPDPISWPALGLQAAGVEECLDDDGSGLGYFTVAGSVTLGSITDPKAAGYYFVTVKAGGATQALLMSPGETRFFDRRVGPVNIGSGVIKVTAFAVQAHGPGDATFAPSVDVSVPYACGSYCRWYGNPSSGCFDTIVLGSARGFDGTFTLTRGYVVATTGGAAGSQAVVGDDRRGYRYYPGNGDYVALAFLDPVPPIR